MDIKLNFINASNDVNNSSVVIFQKNVATDFEEIAVAWTVIRNCGQGDNHPFTYPMESTIGYADSYGNYTPRLIANPGDLFSAVFTPSGDAIQHSGAANSVHEIQLLNALPHGAIDAMVFKDSRVLASKTSVAPQQKAVFQFTPTIWIGVASEVVQGEVMNSAILSALDTEISLLGIASADIVMTGGGPGAQSIPFEFTLQNVMMA